jgi:hypothetical protein
MKFPNKYYGRLYVIKEEAIQIVKDTIKEMDEYEYEYLPDDLITVFSGKVDYVYTHKFDSIDLDKLIEKCYEKGVFLFYVIKEKE